MTLTTPAARRGLLLALAIAIAAILSIALVPARASADVQPVTATFGSGDLSLFSQTNALTGTLGVVPGGYAGANAAQAVYSGGGSNGYSRGIFNVNWQEGDDVWYGGAYLLPTGFKASMQGQVALLRWDNFPSNPTAADQGGVVINGGDKHSYLERDHNNADGSWSQSDLVGPFDLPEGRWFWLEVHQHFGSGTGAYSEVFLDGHSLGSSPSPNMSGRAIERIRYGLVAIAEGKQMSALSLKFDRASVSTSQLGPLGGSATAPAAPAPTSSGPGSASGTTTSGSGSISGSSSGSGSQSGTTHHRRHPRLARAASVMISRCVRSARTFAWRHHRSAANAPRRCAAKVARASRHAAGR